MVVQGAYMQGEHPLMDTAIFQAGKTKRKLKKKAPVHQQALDNVVGNDVEDPIYDSSASS
eukprot:gene39734-49104_t